MKLDRLMNSRITIGKDIVEHESRTIETHIKHLLIAIREAPTSIRTIKFEISIDSLTQLSHTEELAASIDSQIIHTDELALSVAEWRPGVSLQRYHEAIESHAYWEYAEVCDPEKRIGMIDMDIRARRKRYEDQFPDVAKFAPVWKD